MSKSKKYPDSVLEDKKQTVSKIVPQSSLLNAKEVISAIKRTKEKPHIPSCKAGLTPGWRRVTLIMRDEHYKKLKDISYWEKITVKDMLEQVFERFISSLENDPPENKK